MLTLLDNTIEQQQAIHYFSLASTIATNSSCLRSKAGSIIVNNDIIIGEGFNSPPRNKTIEHCLKDSLPTGFKSDRTCCIHAEQRAIMDALRKGNKMEGSRIYFIRLDKDNVMKKAGKPYCTICSKLALDVGIAEFALWHEEGIVVYGTEEYNELSFAYRE